MYDNDYIVLIDENGQPYIAHAFGDRIKNYASNRKNHKYIQRFDNYWGPGKHAYAYSQAEVKMYNAGRRLGKGAKKAAQWLDDHDAGLTERVQARSLERKANRVGKKDRDAGNALAVEAARLRRQSRDEYNRSSIAKGLRSARSAGRKAAQWLDDHDAGLTERVQARSLERKANRVGKKDRDAGNALAVEAARLRRQGKSEYENSGIGRAANTIKKYGGASLNAVREGATAAGKAAASAAGKAGVSISSALVDADLAFENIVGDAYDTINNVIDKKVTGKTASQNLSAATQNALMGLDGAMGEYADAQHAYLQSLNGKSEGTKQKAAKKLADAKAKVSDLLSKTGNVFSKQEKAQIQGALQYDFDPVTGEWVYRGR